MASRWRLLNLDSSGDALWNMAVDECLFESADALPTLRFYTWSQPAYSVGYFQDPHAAQNALLHSDQHLTVVRRLTGGGWVRHGGDLTLSMVLDDPNPYFGRRAQDSYREIHTLYREALRQHFPELDNSQSKTVFSPRSGASCFDVDVRHDLLLKGQKVLGSSQRRRKGRFLHQTSAVLPSSPLFLADEIQNKFAAALGVTFDTIPLTRNEQARVMELIHEKYTTPKWSCKCKGSGHKMASHHNYLSYDPTPFYPS